jgi:hypothetical protein
MLKYEPKTNKKSSLGRLAKWLKSRFVKSVQNHNKPMFQRIITLNPIVFRNRMLLE